MQDNKNKQDSNKSTEDPKSKGSSSGDNKKDNSAGENDIEKIKKERDEYLDGWKRARAELSNYKKMEAQRIEKIIAYANEGLIKDLLVVLDSFDLAIDSMEKSGNEDKGIYLIRAQMEDVLKKYGLERIKVEKGDKFDPTIHEAMIAVDKGEGQESGTILEELERGYKLNGKVIRPSKVKVVKLDE